jgi:hypothetical protein
MEQWNLIQKNHAVVVEAGGGFTLEPIALKDSHMALAITTQHG